MRRKTSPLLGKIFKLLLHIRWRQVTNLLHLKPKQTKIGSGSITPEILATGDIKTNNTYKIKFDIDTIYSVPNYNYGLQYTTSGFVFDETDNNKLVYSESPQNYIQDHILFNDQYKYYYLNPEKSQPMFSICFDLKINHL